MSDKGTGTTVGIRWRAAPLRHFRVRQCEKAGFCGFGSSEGCGHGEPHRVTRRLTAVRSSTKAAPQASLGQASSPPTGTAPRLASPMASSRPLADNVGVEILAECL